MNGPPNDPGDMRGASFEQGKGASGANSAISDLLDSSVRAVPATRYAHGLAGIVVSACLAMVLAGSPTAAIMGASVMLGGSIVLLVFAKLSDAKPKMLRGPMKITLWAVTLLFLATLTLLFTSFFFGKPLPL
jgi:Ca2+/Na+ antiporter